MASHTQTPATLKNKLAERATGNTGLVTQDTFSAFLTQNGVKNKINQIVGGKDGQRFMTAILSAVSANPDLAICDHGSILSAALLGESLKLSPSPQLGQYYMVPFDDNKNNRKMAVFVLGYRGMIQLAVRSGYYKKINVIAIKEGELQNFDPLNEIIDCILIDDDDARERTATIGYYAMFEYMNGFRKAIYWSKTKMEKHALQYSAGYRADKKKGTAYTFWTKDFDGMAFKTMLRQLISKWGIMSIEFQTAYERDTSIMNEDGKIEFIDNTKDTPPGDPVDRGETIDPEAGPEIGMENNTGEEPPLAEPPAE